jgi:putative transposase
VKGRKRHIVVDTQGWLLAVAVHPANIQDRDGAKLVLQRIVGRFPRLKCIWADGAYAGKLVRWAKCIGGWTLELVPRPARQHTFQVLPRRWVVERTFAWLGRQRRLSKDYEALPETTETWIYAAMTGLMLRRLARSPTF